MSKVSTAAITREKLIEALNEDLAREYQAIIAYVKIWHKLWPDVKSHPATRTDHLNEP